ncbi:uncharacterized protein BP5553_04667 [Venustampulla echinocandica]|uniref:Uncharacterized protein n=1 Tax=Venustampulla echinocandica TaxID=2656787 RepID=A0A370TNY6_9HELO|nr:uncharacterized protein BP5553_04667 [Venustampulla echinocandica]RDL37234.1 hypothetical protein BP5553_04667 [Venustampulla echinocandica]
MSSPSQLRPRGSSKFIEGSEATGPDVLLRAQTSNKLLLKILSEMDAMECKQKPTGRNPGHAHRVSSSSLESFASSSSSRSKNTVLPKEKDWRRGLTFGRMSTERLREQYGNGEHDSETLANKVIGRLRALTGGARPYPGP